MFNIYNYTRQAYQKSRPFGWLFLNWSIMGHDWFALLFGAIFQDYFYFKIIK